MKRLLSAALLLAALPLAAARLPKSVIPDHYAISITPDLAAEKFSGQETIDVDIKEPVDTITLHSADIEHARRRRRQRQQDAESDASPTTCRTRWPR